MPGALMLATMTSVEIGAHVACSDAVIVPIGAIEQHGPSCPVGTDTLLAESMSRQVSERTGILLGPCIPVGDSLYHTAFPGTIALRPSTLMAVTRDYVTSLYRSGFRRILVLGTHWDNHFPVAAALSELADDLSELRFIVRDFWEFPEVGAILRAAFDEGGGHADAADVSLLMAMDRGLVRDDLLVAEFPPVRYQVGWRLLRELVTTSGVIGSDQRKASAEVGVRLWDAILQGYETTAKALLA